MSTATQTLGFQEASVEKLPRLACVGTVTEVGEGKLSEAGVYIVQPITIRGTGAGRGVRLNLLYRPEWLDVTFNPNKLEEEYEGGKSLLSVYRRNIATKGGISALKGLAGSEEAFNTLAAALLTAEDKSIQGVQQVLRDFFLSTNEDVEIGYILKQRQQKVTNPETGETEYELTNGYEVGEWFFNTEENRKRLVARAAKTRDGSFRIGFDQD